DVVKISYNPIRPRRVEITLKLRSPRSLGSYGFDLVHLIGSTVIDEIGPTTPEQAIKGGITTPHTRPVAALQVSQQLEVRVGTHQHMADVIKQIPKRGGNSTVVEAAAGGDGSGPTERGIGDQRRLKG